MDLVTETWGPWIDHDGKGCPVKGQLVQIERFSGEKKEFVAWTEMYFPRTGISKPCNVEGDDKDPKDSNWAWPETRDSSIKRYRVKRSASFMMLLRIAESPVKNESPTTKVPVPCL